MDVKFFTTTSAKLPSLAIANGQLIYLEDKDAGYYDMGGYRRPLSGMRLVSELPTVGQSDIIYVLINSATGHADASIWNSATAAYVPLTGYVATTSTVGLVKPDGTTITISQDGTISCHAEVTSLPASAITYNNTQSGLVAQQAQAAIDELSGSVTSAIATANSANTAAANASTAANSAISTANSASEQAAAATTAVAAASTAITDLQTRIAALESLADIVLTIQQ